MQSVTATFRNGQVELIQKVDWPDGTQVEVTPISVSGGCDRVGETHPEPYRDLVRRLAGSFGDYPFERPPQGEFERREAW
jgi:hypothetical protein